MYIYFIRFRDFDQYSMTWHGRSGNNSIKTLLLFFFLQTGKMKYKCINITLTK